MIMKITAFPDAGTGQTLDHIERFVSEAWGNIPPWWQMTIELHVKEIVVIPWNTFSTAKMSQNVVWTQHRIIAELPEIPHGKLEDEMSFVEMFPEGLKVYGACRCQSIFDVFNFKRDVTRALGIAVYLCEPKVRKAVATCGARFAEGSASAKLLMASVFRAPYLFQYTSGDEKPLSEVGMNMIEKIMFKQIEEQAFFGQPLS